jgi:hypothetical protein
MLNTYDSKKTLKKFAVSLLEVLVVGTIVVLTENGSYLFLIPALEALRNFLKHGLGLRVI